MTPEEQAKRNQEVRVSAAAYMQLMDAIVPETQYARGVREDRDDVMRLSGVVDEVHARHRERRAGESNEGNSLTEK